MKGSIFTVALVLVFIAVAGSSARAADAAKSGKKSSAGMIAVVISETTQIYEKPDLDAKVVAVVKRGTRLPISKGTRGEFAKFHRTRVDGKIGWVLILDIRSEAAAKKVFTKALAEAYKPGPFAEDPPEGDDKLTEGREENEPFAFTKSASFVVGLANYKESIAGGEYSTDLMSYGIKLTGPDVLIDGPLMDVNLLFHYGAPDYYRQLSATNPSGFLIFADANLLLPIVLRQDSLVGIGAGPLLVVSNIQAAQGAQNYSMWQMNLGATVELTGGLRFGSWCVRVDGKYMFEKKTYRQVQLAIGTVF
jgi:hypothetical protein